MCWRAAGVCAVRRADVMGGVRMYVCMSVCAHVRASPRAAMLALHSQAHRRQSDALHTTIPCTRCVTIWLYRETRRAHARARLVEVLARLRWRDVVRRPACGGGRRRARVRGQWRFEMPSASALGRGGSGHTHTHARTHKRHTAATTRFNKHRRTRRMRQGTHCDETKHSAHTNKPQHHAPVTALSLVFVAV